MSTRDELATIILNGILHHMPNIEPRALELILSRTAQIHRDRYERQQAEAIGHVQEQARVESLAQMEANQRARAEAAANARRIKDALRAARKEELREALKDVPLPGTPKKQTRRKRFPQLTGEIRQLVKEHPRMQCRQAKRHFEMVYGADFISYAGFKPYWDEAMGVGV